MRRPAPPWAGKSDTMKWCHSEPNGARPRSIRVEESPGLPDPQGRSNRVRYIVVGAATMVVSCDEATDRIDTAIQAGQSGRFLGTPLRGGSE